MKAGETDTFDFLDSYSSVLENSKNVILVNSFFLGLFKDIQTLLHLGVNK